MHVSICYSYKNIKYKKDSRWGGGAVYLWTWLSYSEVTQSMNNSMDLVIWSEIDSSIRLLCYVVDAIAKSDL